MRRPMVYIAHAITGPMMEGPWVWLQHADDVARLCSQVALAGASPLLPGLLPGLTLEECLESDRELVWRSDALLVHGSRWVKGSSGVQREVGWAEEQGIPTFEWIGQLIRWLGREADYWHKGIGPVPAGRDT